MAIKNVKMVVKHYRDSLENFDQANPILLNGQIVIIDGEDGQLYVKVGDGLTRFKVLPIYELILSSELDNIRTTISSLLEDKADKSDLEDLASKEDLKSLDSGNVD
jgi:hypothetical protein